MPSGVNDPYRTEESVKEFYDAVASSKLDIELVNFDGVHEVFIECVSRVLRDEIAASS